MHACSLSESALSGVYASFVVSGVGDQLLLTVGFVSDPRPVVRMVRSNELGGVLLSDTEGLFESIHTYLQSIGAMFQPNAGVWMPPRAILMQEPLLRSLLAPPGVTSAEARDRMLNDPSIFVVLCERPQNRRTLSVVVRHPSGIQKTMALREEDRYCFQVELFFSSFDL